MSRLCCIISKPACIVSDDLAAEFCCMWWGEVVNGVPSCSMPVQTQAFDTGLACPINDHANMASI